MAMFNFGSRQKMHTQLLGRTTGNEMFRVDEYNTRKRNTFIGFAFCIFIFLIEYFYIIIIPLKWNILLFMAFFGSGFFCYSNFKQ